ncbi:MAG TPA: hypothetical protein VGG04_11770 [Candidatus Sulfotelmatobacter sp.]
MTSGRVVVIALLLTPLCAFAQQSSDAGKALDAKIKPPVGIAEGLEILNPAQAGPSILPPMQFPENGNVNVCFKMRTYVMARDSKDSDSTHLVRYTTCTPANNRAVKKVARPDDER